jgi:hypothetical protein
MGAAWAPHAMCESALSQMSPKTRADGGHAFGGHRRQSVRATAPDIYYHVGVALPYVRRPSTAVRAGPAE